MPIPCSRRWSIPSLKMPSVTGGSSRIIRLSYRIVNSGCLVICEDNGVGVAEEDKEKIFLREFGKHTGFGLFLSREILGITGFSIRETGIPGNGARFEILIPEGSFRENKTSDCAGHLPYPAGSFRNFPILRHHLSERSESKPRFLSRHTFPGMLLPDRFSYHAGRAIIKRDA